LAPDKTEVELATTLHDASWPDVTLKFPDVLDTATGTRVWTADAAVTVWFLLPLVPSWNVTVKTAAPPSLGWKV
jgi:hypothetical protein